MHDENGEPTSYLADIKGLKSQLLSQELQEETLYASMKEKTLASQVPANAGGEEFTQVLVGVQNKLVELCSKTHTEETPLKLTGLEPPSWDDKKASLYRWKEMFIHTMAQARIKDDQVQIT